MLKDCLEIFKAEMERTTSADKDRIILDRYIPADGDYIIVKSDGQVIDKNIKFDKKSGAIENEPLNFEDICFYDYHSRLVSMDKPQDPKKVIHSNNYLSFWVKQESLTNGKLDEAAIDRYFDVLKDPRKKYTKPKDREMYDYIAERIGEIDQEKLKHHREWIKSNIFALDKLNITLSGKNYLKIFFEDDRNLYLEEEQRYLMTKIFNKNDYNVEIDGEILGLPNDNLGLNAKKPYLENKTQKTNVPYLISPEEVVLQRKFFDYLMNYANVGKTNLFFDSEKKKIIPLRKGEMLNDDFTGYFLQIQKGKEVIILHQDTIVDYSYFLRKRFQYQNILGLDDKKNEENIYKEYQSRDQIQSLIDDIIFSKWLTGNYFTPEEEVSAEGELKRNLIWSREKLFAWLYKGMSEGIDRILDQVSMNMVKSSIQSGYIKKARKQFNLMCSFQEYFSGGYEMASIYNEVRGKLQQKINQKEKGEIETDKEYFYAVGQLVNYYISLNKTKEKVHSLANPFFNAKSDTWIKEKLKQFFMKYNYCLKYAGRRFNHLYGMILDYQLEGKVKQEDIIAGYISENLIYESSNEKEEEEA